MARYLRIERRLSPGGCAGNSKPCAQDQPWTSCNAGEPLALFQPLLEEMAERYLYAVATSVPSVRGARFLIRSR